MKKRIFCSAAVFLSFFFMAAYIFINPSTNPPTVNRHLFSSACPMEDFSPCAPRTDYVRALVFLVEFQDVTFYNSRKTVTDSLLTTDDLQQLLFGPKNPLSPEYPYESGSAYYSRSSYNQLDFTGDVLYYKTNGIRDSYDTTETTGNSAEGYEKLAMEILSYYDSQIDYSDYDQNNDGYIDALYFSVPLDQSPKDKNWWGNQSTWVENNQFKIDERQVEKYVILDAPPLENTRTYYNRVWIHETGHLLGLSDYYHIGSKPCETTEGFVGSAGFDMMDEMSGDHNAFSKLMLGWIGDDHVQIVNPNSFGNGSSYILPPVEKNGDVILIPASDYNGSYCSSYYLLENVCRAENNLTATAEEGIRIWYINAQLTNDYWRKNKKMFAYDSNVTKSSTQLIELVGGLYKSGVTITPNSGQVSEQLPVQIKIGSKIATGYQLLIRPIH